MYSVVIDMKCYWLQNAVAYVYSKTSFFYPTVNNFNSDFSRYKNVRTHLGSHIVRAWKAHDL